MHQGEYDPARQSPYRARPHASPQYVGTQFPASGNASPPPAAGGYAPPYWTPGQGQPLRHSGMGIASFVLAVVSVALLVGSVAVIVVTANRNGGKPAPDAKTTIAGGLGILLGLLLNVIGTILGAVGVAQRGRKLVFVALGLTFNLVLLAMLGGMFVWGFLKK